MIHHIGSFREMEETSEENNNIHNTGIQSTAQ